MNIRIIFYSLFRSPVQKSVRCPFFFFFLFKLFATGIPDRNTRLTMGYSNASDLSSNIFRQINEPINMTPLCWSLGEYEEFIERYEDSENKLESHGKKLYSIQIRSYLDDSLIQSPMYEELLGHDLSKNSYFKVPKCKTDHAVYLHLNVLSKIFSNLRDITC